MEFITNKKAISVTAQVLQELAALQTQTLATMHGPSFYGDCSKALLDLDVVMKEVLGGEPIPVFK